MCGRLSCCTALSTITTLICLLSFDHPVQGATGQSRKFSGLRFIVNGDWGGVATWPRYSPVQKLVSAQMARLATDNNIDFVLSTGDNFYEDGVKNVFDSRFKETFEDVYDSQSLHVPWYVILGNHDYHGNTSAQVAYTNRSERWNLPDYNYTMQFKIPGAMETVTIVMIDTVILCGVSDGVTPLPGPRDPDRARSELAWIEEELEKAQESDYVLVVGHYPIFSVGVHGSGGCLPDILLPMLYKYKVDAYICGHDHNIQHLSSVSGDWEMEHLLVGAGSRINPRGDHRLSAHTIATRFFSADKTGAFAFFEVDSERAKISFINGLGRIIYSTSFGSRKKTDKTATSGSDAEMNNAESQADYEYRKNNENKQYAGMYRIPESLPLM